MIRSVFNIATSKPSVIGTGLIALDIVMSENTKTPLYLWAGGTCGNVLTILSYLSWQSIPVARLSNDKAAQIIRNEFKDWGLQLQWASVEPESSTPIFLHYIQKNKSKSPTHRFSRNCPECGATYPNYKPVHASAITDIAASLTNPQVLFIDRISRGAINLAHICAEKGAIIVFEPSGIQDENLFNEILSLAHIVKYADHRLPNLDVLDRSSGPLLEIQTRGNAGLVYRRRIESNQATDWQQIDAFVATDLRDAAGAGDWCTAGIIHLLGQYGSAGLQVLHSKQFHEALVFGQALAAWNCQYEGARGGMYQVSREMFQSEVISILKREQVSSKSNTLIQQAPSLHNVKANILRDVCIVCRVES